MSYTNQPQDASMEDILVSIRKILSTDEEAPLPKDVVPKAQEESAPLELTERVEDAPEAPKPLNPEPEEEASPQEAPEVSEIQEPLMSEETLAASTAVLSSLKEAVNAPEPIPTHSQTIDELARDLLSPLLKEWLDKNLSSLVEKVVRQEIQKLTKSL